MTRCTSAIVSILILALVTPANASDCTKQPTGLPFANYTPSAAHNVATAEAAQELMPRDEHGHPNATGQLCVVLFGMSNAHYYNDAFSRLYKPHSNRNPRVVLVRASKPGHTAMQWANSAHPVWDAAVTKVAKAGCKPAQVQAVQMWMTQARPDVNGVMTEAQMRSILANVSARWPNTKLGYVSGLPSTLWSDDPALNIKDRNRAPEWSVNSDSRLLASFVEKTNLPFVVRFIDFWSDGSNQNPITGAVEVCARKAVDGVHPTTTGEPPVNGKIWWGTFLLEQLYRDPFAWGWLFQ